jgi:hypothetical protein
MPDAILPECVYPEYIHHTGEVVAQNHQAKFAPAFFQAAHQEVAYAGPVLEGAEACHELVEWGCSTSWLRVFRIAPAPAMRRLCRSTTAWCSQRSIFL